MKTYFHNIIMLVFHHVIMSFQTKEMDPSWFLFLISHFLRGEVGTLLTFTSNEIGSSVTRISSEEQKQGDLGSSKDSMT